MALTIRTWVVEIAWLRDNKSNGTWC
jgi:hypothetical protein